MCCRRALAGMCSQIINPGQNLPQHEYPNGSTQGSVIRRRPLARHCRAITRLLVDDASAPRPRCAPDIEGAGRHAVQRGAAAFARRPLAMEALRNSMSGAQLVEERLRLFLHGA